jgi:hypothetical protein
MLMTLFYNIILKIEHKLSIFSGLSPPPPHVKNTGCAPDSVPENY